MINENFKRINIITTFLTEIEPKLCSQPSFACEVHMI